MKPGQRKACCIVASSVVVWVVICIAYCQHKELVERERETENLFSSHGSVDVERTPLPHHYPVCPLFSIQIGFSNVWMIGKQNLAVDDSIQLQDAVHCSQQHRYNLNIACVGIRQNIELLCDLQHVHSSDYQEGFKEFHDVMKVRTYRYTKWLFMCNRANATFRFRSLYRKHSALSVTYKLNLYLHNADSFWC